MTTEQTANAAVFAALVCPQANIGLFIIQPDRINPMWKIIAGEVEPKESIPAALLRETEEESGFKMPSFRDGNGNLVVGDAECRVYSLGVEKNVRGRRGLHDQHYFIIIVKDPRELIALDGQTRKEDDNETILTKVFDLDEVARIPNFLPPQRTLLEKVLGEVKNIKSQANA